MKQTNNKNLNNINNNIKHIAIIMDGNGRWANMQGKKRAYGHKQGAKTIKTITTHIAKIGIKYLTLYAFSTENWARDKDEVKFLMSLLSKFLKAQTSTFVKNSIKFKVIGDISKLSLSLQKQIQQLEFKTKNNTRLTQFLALNYGAKDEIIRAIKKIKNKKLPINEITLNNNLDTKNADDVDILIRTGAEKRLSNFMLWQCAYSELFFSKTMWPDFSINELDKICKKYHKRNRRFGKN